MASLFFSTIEVTRQAFYRTALSNAIVNLKPIVPGHVLVIPTRAVARLSDLNKEEFISLFMTVQEVGKVVERAYKADGLTIACQDGKAAGQSIEHVHVHILPRRFMGDRFEHASDDVYPALEMAEAELSHQFRNIQKTDIQRLKLKVDADEDRKPRTIEDMEKEARWLNSFFSSS